TNMRYSLTKNLHLSLSSGFSQNSNEEYRTNPSSVNNPSLNFTSERSSSSKVNSNKKSWIVEPKLQWSREKEKSKWNALVGMTVEYRYQNTLRIDGSNFTSNDFILNMSNAITQKITKDTESSYKYIGFFGRLNYTARDKYIVNLTGRRDGSSRFGANNRYANFGAVGAAWLFGRETALQNASWLNFGKLRASYGVAGSDLIGDYQYMNTFGITGVNYDGAVGIDPLRLYNPDFGWETNRKLEAALELELFNSRLAPTISWFHNRSSNQLVGVPLSAVTGFASVQSNLAANVQNTGWEFTLRSVNIQKKHFKWITNINVTVPRNKLIAFPNLEESAYANQYEIGKPVTIRKMYHFLGVNKETGIYEFEDVNNDGKLSVDDKKTVVEVGVKSFGGINN